jgi:hypothetical protein
VAVKSWNVGDVLSAADMNAWTVPIIVSKSVATSRNTTTTMTNDPDLQLPVASSAVYDINGCLFYTGNATSADFKFTFSLPSGAGGYYFPCRQNLSGNFTGSFGNQWTDTATANTTGTGVANLMVVFIKGFLSTAGTAGNFTLQWAQNTSNGTGTTVKENSFISAQRIG